MRIIKEVTQSNDYLKDESQLVGNADSLYFCHSTEEVEEIVHSCYKNNIPITIQGALTGICGGAVPRNGAVINLSEMNDIIGISYNKSLESYIIKVQPGLLLKDLSHFLKSKKLDGITFDSNSLRIYQEFLIKKAFMFPTDPTETLASVGGMVACEASGACSYKYGSIRQYVQGLTLVTSSQTIHIERGMYTYSDLHKVLHFEEGTLPVWKSNDHNLKDVAGLYYSHDMDLIDLIIGSEGIFGVMTELDLVVMEEPFIRAGIILFLNEDNRLADYVDFLRTDSGLEYKNSIAAIEYFDSSSLQLLNQYRCTNPTLKKLPIISKAYVGSIYLEFHVESEEQLDSVLEEISINMDQYGINVHEQWLGLEPSDFEKLKLFRHAVPECVNILIANKKQHDSRISKLGTDMSVPDFLLSSILSMYNKDIKRLGISSVIFGHIGDNHLHVNLIPDSYEQYSKGKEMISKWAIYVTKHKGSVTAEHGIGKLKKELLQIMVHEDDLINMKKIKRLLEPKCLINQGTLLD
jgi:D-lactate dehydrogenase (cytochrome)